MTLPVARALSSRWARFKSWLLAREIIPKCSTCGNDLVESGWDGRVLDGCISCEVRGAQTIGVVNDTPYAGEILSDLTRVIRLGEETTCPICDQTIRWRPRERDLSCGCGVIATLQSIAADPREAAWRVQTHGHPHGG